MFAVDTISNVTGLLNLPRSCIHLVFSCTLIGTELKRRVGVCAVVTIRGEVALTRMSGLSSRTRSQPDPLSPFIRRTKTTQPSFAAT